MAYRREVETHQIVKSIPLLVRLIENPIIDDVVITEARLEAAILDGVQQDNGHRVDRTIRDYLIRLGVER